MTQSKVGHKYKVQKLFK